MLSKLRDIFWFVISWPPNVGVCIALLAVVAVVMATRGDRMLRTEKIGWVVCSFLLLLGEIYAMQTKVVSDANEAIAAQDERFAAILTQNQKDFETTASRLDNVAGLAERSLKSVVGGDRVVNGAAIGGVLTKKDVQIDFFGFVRPSLFEGFNKVTIMGAHFCLSLPYTIWSNEGVHFRRSKGIVPPDGKHSLGSRKVSIYYLSKRNWSKKHRDSLGFTNGKIPANIVRAIKEKIGDEPYIWVANKDVGDKALGNGDLISNVSHGLNTHKDKHAAVCLSALNLKPDHQNIFKQMFNISSDELRMAGFFQSQYQAMFRCSLRDAKSTADITLVVTDIHFAEWFARLFEEQANISIQELIPDLTTAAPVTVPLTNKEKQAKNNDKSKELVLAAQEIRNERFICAKGGQMTPNTIIVSPRCQETPDLFRCP